MNVRSAVAIVAVFPVIIGAREARILQPTTKWELNYGAQSCRLGRQFGEGDEKSQLLIESDGPNHMDVLVIGKPFATSRARVPAKFTPAQTDAEQGFASRNADGVPAIVWSTFSFQPPEQAAFSKQREAEAKRQPTVRPPATDPSQALRWKAERLNLAANATQFEVVSKAEPVALATGPMDAPLKALDQCVRDSMRTWGIDPDLEDRIARPAWTARPGAWLSPEDYPQGSLAAGTQSDVRIRLLLDAAGKPTRCTSLSHFADKRFETVVCERAMERAKFEPAELADGTKVPSYVVTAIRFRIYD